METMYQIPSQSLLQKVVVDRSVVRGETEPLMVFEDTKKRESG